MNKFTINMNGIICILIVLSLLGGCYIAYHYDYKETETYIKNGYERCIIGDKWHNRITTWCKIKEDSCE